MKREERKRKWKRDRRKSRKGEDHSPEDKMIDPRKRGKRKESRGDKDEK